MKTKEEVKKEREDKRRKEDLERMGTRLNNMSRLINSLIGEYNMVKAIQSRMYKEEHEKTPYDWRKDKSLSVNK